MENFSLTDFSSPVFKIPHNINKHVEFYSSDTFETWQKGRQTLGADWAYYTTEIDMHHPGLQHNLNVVSYIKTHI